MVRSGQAQLLNISLWDWDPGMGRDNDDALGRYYY